MSETVTVAIITATVALLAVLIERGFELAKEFYGEKRWYADYFLGRKIDAFVHLHSELIDWQFAINQYGHFPPTTMEEYRNNVQAHEKAFLRAMVVAKVYMDGPTEEKIRAALGAFRQANTAIWFSLSDSERVPQVNREIYDPAFRNVDWASVSNTYEVAGDCLSVILNPKVLNRFGK